MTTSVGNRIKETTALAGTGGPFTLLGAQTGFEAYQNGVSVGDWTFYCVIDGIDYEVGYGQLTSSTSLTRDTVLDSSNGGSKLDLSASTKTIFCEVPAQHLVFTDKDGAIADPSPYRNAIIVQTIAAMQAEAGLVDGESIIVLKGTTDDDGLGGVYEYRSGSVVAISAPDVVDATGMGVGRMHKVTQKDNYGRLIPRATQPGSPAQGWFAYSDGTPAGGAGFGDSGAGFYTYTGSAWVAVGTTVKTGAGSPVGSVLPDVQGQIYLNTTNSTAWVSTGLTNNDWDIISNEEWTATVDAGTQKLDNLGRVDFVSLSTEPTDAEEGMLAYSNGVASTAGFGDEGEGFYWYNGSAWALVGSGVAAGSVALSAIADITAYTVLGRKTGTTGSPEEVNEAQFKTMMNLEPGTDIQAYAATLAELGGWSYPAGGPFEVVGKTATQTLTNKTINQPSLVLKQSATPTPTAEGEIWWDTDGNFLVIGNGVDQTILGASSGDLLSTNNLSDLSNATTARTNLGLLALATKATVGNAEIDALAVDTAELAANAVTLAKMATISDDRILGNVSGGAAIPAQLTAAQIKTMLAIANTDITGLSVFAPSTYTEILGTDIEDDVVLPGSGAITVPSGADGARPGSPANGMIRYNTTSGVFEGYDSGWVAFESAGASAMDWTTVAELLPASYDFDLDGVILYDDSATTAKKTPFSKLAMKVNNQVDNYTLVITDGNALVEVEAATAKTVTIPTNAAVAFQIGTTIHIAQKGAGAVDVDPDVGVTLNESAGNTCYEQHSVIAITKTGTNEWLIYGDAK
jgi:hypothetical protein